ncbi:MAG TPA: aminoglycoside phosphotransferase family protein [Actinomycetota bacterium]|nr:aminoglycoside phosphotransferase family protein [Actinomycetota bacterium]
MPDLLKPSSVVRYLVSRGVLGGGSTAQASELEGGISNIVLKVGSKEGQMVVKQALPQLRVDQEWFAKTDRAVSEGRALEIFGKLTPDAVPRVLDIDREGHAITMSAAPPRWQNWKTLLLSGEIDTQVGTRLGKLLGTWHASTGGSDEIEQEFGDLGAFDQLRLDPYHRSVIRSRPDLESVIDPYIQQLRDVRRCLVHGDFSPKNVLVGPTSSDVWILDFEVAHYGNPAFDLAFMMSHLIMKAIHRPADAAHYHTTFVLLLSSYLKTAPIGLIGSEMQVVGQTGCLLLARVLGKSPAEYLTKDEQDKVVNLGEAFAREPHRVEAAWYNVLEAVA